MSDDTVTRPAVHLRRPASGARATPPSLDFEPADSFEQLLGAAVHYRIATGPHAGRRALTLHTVSANPPASNPCIAQLSGFSLHAGTCCRARDGGSLEQLCRYIARPAVSNERLSVNDHGHVVRIRGWRIGDSWIGTEAGSQILCSAPTVNAGYGTTAIRQDTRGTVRSKPGGAAGRAKLLSAHTSSPYGDP